MASDELLGKWPLLVPPHSQRTIEGQWDVAEMRRRTGDSPWHALGARVGHGQDIAVGCYFYSDGPPPVVVAVLSGQPPVGSDSRR